MNDFLPGVIVGLILGFLAFFVLPSNTPTTPDEIDLAETVCASNDGIAFVYPRGAFNALKAKCKNGAEFNGYEMAQKKLNHQKTP